MGWVFYLIRLDLIKIESEKTENIVKPEKIDKITIDIAWVIG